MKTGIASVLLVVGLILSVGPIGCGGEAPPETTEYTLTISSTEGGEVTTPGDGTFSYDQGTEVPLVAFPHTGYRFVKWTGDVDTIGDVNAASTAIAINARYSITANFVAQYTLTTDSTDGGKVIAPWEGAFMYDAGTVVNLRAAPEEGCYFVNWTGDVNTIADVSAASTTITMNDNYSILANFEEIPSNRPPITFAIAGPMTEFQGEQQWWGAEVARDEINAGAGVNVGGVYHKIELVQVETNEPLDPSGADGVTALGAVIDDVDFVIGGFRAQNVMVYRDVAMDAQKIFMNCGAAKDALQFSVVTDYDKYKYWFKTTPINEAFLVNALLKMTGTTGAVLRNTLASYGDAVGEDYRVPGDGKLRVAILMENALWCEGMVAPAQTWLPRLGFDVVGTWLISPTAADITAELSQIAAAKPHVIFTAFSGTVGTVYSVQKTELGIPAMTIGINVPGEQKQHWTDSEGKCNGEIMLDSWAEGLEVTAKTTAFSDAFTAETGEYPIYTALTYDAIYQLKEAIEATDSLDADDIIQYLETHPYMGVDGLYAYYPMPAIDLGNGVYALSEAQVRALYPSLATYNQTDWLCAASGGPHIAHDLVYGPGYVTGIGSQWQDGHKVCVWPVDFGDASDAALTDQYGCWNFEYPGTVDVMIPIEGFLAL